MGKAESTPLIDNINELGFEGFFVTNDAGKLAVPLPPPVPRAGKASRWKKISGIALGLASAAGILMYISMELFLKVVSVLGINLTVGSILVMLLTYRKSREITSQGDVHLGGYECRLPAGLLALSQGRAGRARMAAGFGARAGAGVAWSLVTPLFREGTAVKRAGNIWYLAVWGAIFGTGLVIGNSGAYVVGCYRMTARPRIAPPAPRRMP